MKYKLAIFDLDGTLSDSFPWFLRIVNQVADKHGFRRINGDEVETLRGKGSRELIQFLRVPMWKLPAIARDMRALKMAQIDDIPLFPGVDRLLHRLASSGVAVAIVSSDHEANARRALGPANAQHVSYFECGASLFGKSAKFKRVLRHADVSAGEAISIGDEIRDLEASRKAGIAFGAVTWGYATPQALQSRGPQELFLSLDDIITKLA